jgi:hypothetical protein
VFFRGGSEGKAEEIDIGRERRVRFLFLFDKNAHESKHLIAENPA